jgi:methylmalonyl-CoA mutase cobalamin-binding subunit
MCLILELFMDERLEDRDGTMRNREHATTLSQAIGMSLALTGVLTAPVAVAAATPTGIVVSSASASTMVENPAVEAEAAASGIRTSAILAGVAIGVAVLVGLWWYLVVRARRD